ncbi:DUF4239 domain-containing protein [Corallococcus sp. AB049A]|uniref:DUF4239 domain-containing protein n=1 Tax=Corallococcus interemptor TaxID=2316720 RepID=A0A3A8QDM4_9BACT|nr:MULTISPECIES: DUF4239 domain-containing protein [Corallococcus]RKH48217.1 DUF4239 domain-containing protein [Corallococcus sp. AB050B]RKH66809.1 DUF4239 domain-containing protein [Corallococcus interemptor]RKI73799.1 DUF4239 domain-containing protein [Corallococcus sp. AB049A]
MLQILDAIPVWLLALMVMGLLFLSLESGHRLSHRKPGLGDASALQASVLGLVALLLAFSFSMASDRYSLRRTLVVKESNAIGTLYLRLGYLPEPARDELRARLRRYTDLRLEGYQAVGDLALFATKLQESKSLQSELWARLEALAPRVEAPVLILVTQAMNDVFDVSDERLAAAHNLIPTTIFVLLLVGMLGSGVLLGYRPEAQVRGLLSWTLFVVILTAVMFTLLDLDLPTRGRIRVDQQPLRSLQEQLRAHP